GRRLARLVLGVPLLGAGAGGLWLHGRLRASLPQLEGERTLPGLSAPVRVERDAQGVPRLVGKTRLDLSRALGFVHGQERYFQMDLLRRRAAGEIAELVGPAALKLDRAVRVHRFRSVAERVFARAPAAERSSIQAYAEGVNAGLAALGAPPFEYLALRVAPLPWRPEDTILAELAMFVTLQSGLPERESLLGVMHDVLPAALFAFLAPSGTEWDAPLVGGAFKVAPVPGPEVLDLRRAAPPKAAAQGPSAERAAVLEPDPDLVLGSNNWAVAGAHTASGAPLLADDMHLQITVP